MQARGASTSLRFARRVAADPAAAVARWRAVSAGKSVGCSPPIPVPEILHAAGLLAVFLRDPGTAGELSRGIDAWVLAPEAPGPPANGLGKPRFDFPRAVPPGIPDSLDLLEALAEWAGGLSGRPVTEGGLWNSIRTFREWRHLLRLLREGNGTGPRGFRSGEVREIVRAGDFLPPEAHSRLIARFLGVPHPSLATSTGGEGGDPLLALTRRLMAGQEGEQIR